MKTINVKIVVKEGVDLGPAADCESLKKAIESLEILRKWSDSEYPIKISYEDSEEMPRDNTD